jgi:hypothetical protein
VRAVDKARNSHQERRRKETHRRNKGKRPCTHTPRTSDANFVCLPQELELELKRVVRSEAEMLKRVAEFEAMAGSRVCILM